MCSIRRAFFFLTGFYGSIYPSQDILRDRALHNCCSPVPPTNGRASYTWHPRSTPPVDIPPRSFLLMIQLQFLASDAPIDQQTLTDILSWLWPCAARRGSPGTSLWRYQSFPWVWWNMCTTPRSPALSGRTSLRPFKWCNHRLLSILLQMYWFLCTKSHGLGRKPMIQLVPRDGCRSEDHWGRR